MANDPRPTPGKNANYETEKDTKSFRPPETLVIGTSVIGDVESLIGFAIIGHAKAGTLS
jgi:hypothetical protein